MKYLIVLLPLLVLLSCHQKPLSEEEQAALKKEKKERQIRRISDSEILEEAKRQGEQIVAQLIGKTDTISSFFEAQWYGYSDSISIEDAGIKGLMEAYLYAKENSQPVVEHVDDLKNGKLIYAQPMDDGVWVIYLDKKKLVKGM